MSYNMPVFPFTANTLQRVPIEVGDVSPFPSLGVFWTFLRTNSPGGGRVIRNLAHLSALPDLSSLDPPHYTLSRASPTSVQETECEYVMQTSGQVLITMGKCLRTSLRDPLPPPLRGSPHLDYNWGLAAKSDAHVVLLLIDGELEQKSARFALGPTPFEESDRRPPCLQCHAGPCTQSHSIELG